MKKYNPRKEWENLLIETKFRELLAEEKVTDWAQFRKLLKVAMKSKELKNLSAGGEATGKAAKNLLAMMLNGATGGMAGLVKQGLELGGQIKDIADVVGKAGELNDKAAEKSPIFSYFNIDDGYSELVDDRLEDEFLKWLPTWIAGRTGEIKPEEDNINAVFEEFLRQRGDHDETVSDAGEMRRFTDLDVPEDESKFEKLYNKVGSGVKGFWSGLF